VPETAELISQLDREHELGESNVRELQHLLLAWELLGESRRAPFATAAKHYLSFYLEHMRLEETVILPAALKVLSAEDWQAIDAAFEANCDPLTGKYPRDPMYEQLFTRIVNHAPAPIGLGED
jgi:hemerythrin-like domain-containing protein